MPHLDDELIKHIPQLKRYAVSLTSDPTNADDLVQDCLIRVLVRAYLWNGVRRPQAYLLSVLHNVFMDMLKRRRNEPTAHDWDAGLYCLESADGPGDRLAIHDIEQALNHLPDEQRHVIELVGLRGLTYREAARLLDVPVGTVMSRLHRGRGTLRCLLDDLEPPPADAGEPRPVNGGSRA